MLGDRWTILLLREAHLGVTRFDEFVARTGINRAALTSRLKMMVEAGLIERNPPRGRPAEYRLTEAGRDLAPVLGALKQWGARHLFEPGETPAMFAPR